MSGNRPQWGELWGGPGRPIVSELQGGYVAPPVPPGYVDPPRGAHPIEIIEPTDGYWTMAGRFGQRFQGRLPSLPGAVVPLVQNQRLPGPPAPIWVSFFRFDRNVLETGELPTDTSNAEIRGRITYGAGGAQNVTEVDIISGVQFPIVCNSIQLDLVTYQPELAVLDPRAPVANPYVTGSLVAGVMMGKGAGGGALPPTWTSPWVGPGGGENFQELDFVVPDFARSVAFHVNTTDPAVLALIELRFISQQLTVLKTLNADASYGVLTQEKGAALPAGVNVVRLFSDVLPVGTRAALQFFLAL